MVSCSFFLFLSNDVHLLMRTLGLVVITVTTQRRKKRAYWWERANGSTYLKKYDTQYLILYYSVLCVCRLWS